MNGWRNRVSLGIIFLLAILIHGNATESLPNSPEGMFVFHGSAVAVELLLMYCTPALLDGRLCDDMQTTCLVSIVFNFLGWLLYMAYAPPVFFDTFSVGLCYVQLIRLILGDDGTSYIWNHLVRRGHHGGS